jgi:hypothetical protein
MFFGRQPLPTAQLNPLKVFWQSQKKDSLYQGVEFFLGFSGFLTVVQKNIQQPSRKNLYFLQKWFRTFRQEPCME